MDIINFLFGLRDPTGFALVGVVEIEADLTISESHERSASTTTHAVEAGAQISDHVVKDPAKVNLNGFVTDSRAAVIGADRGRTQSAFDLLTRLWQDGEPLTVVTARRTYENMIVTSLSLPKQTPSSMDFSVELTHVRIVTSQIVDLPKNAATQEIADKAAPEVDTGRQTTQDPTPDTAAKGQSALDRVLTWAGAL